MTAYADDALIERALRWTEGFAAWPAPTMARLMAGASLVRFRRGRAFSCTERGEPQTLAIVSGYVFMSRSRPGSEVCSTVGIVGPGRLLGNLNMLTPVRGGGGFDYRVHENLVAVQFPCRRLIELLDAEPALWRDMTRMLLRQQFELLANLLDQVTGELHPRLAATIEQLAVQHGVASGEGIKLRVRLSQADLAMMLQVSRQTVNRGLKWLADFGAITPDYKSITIIDRERLLFVAGQTR